MDSHALSSMINIGGTPTQIKSRGRQNLDPGRKDSVKKMEAAEPLLSK